MRWMWIPMAAMLFSPFSSAADAPSATPAGHWEGTITVPSGNIAFIVDLEGAEGRPWKAEADVPEQGIRNLAVIDLTVSGSEVSFTLPDIPGTPTFSGRLAQDGAKLTGNLTQAGQTFPAELVRQGEARFGEVPDDGVKVVESGVPGEGVAGEWHGVLSVGPHRLRLILTVAAATTGGFEGQLLSVDQGGSAIPLANISAGTDRSIAFEVPSIGGAFRGQLNADGSEAAGQWSQGGQALPLTFKRAK